MFPNTRLMVVAILAAIAGIGCGLGLFATFRVNHEPLTRFAEGSPPLQLAFDNLALGPDARVPLEARLPLGTAGKMISAPVIVPTPAAAAEPAGADAVPAGADAAPAGSAVQEPAAADAAADQSNTASLATAVESPERSSATPEAIAVPPAQQQATPAAQDQPPADPAATTPSIAQTATIATAADDQQPTSQTTKAEEMKTAKPARVSRPAMQARRPVKIVRIRRTVTTTAAQPSYQYSQPTYSQSAYSPSAYSQPAYSQSAYGWTSGTSQAPQPVKRVVAKRHRAPAKPTPAVQATPAAATAGLINNQ